MLILSLILFILSNSLTLRQDKSILYSRATITVLVIAALISYDNLNFLFLNKGIGIFGYLYYDEIGSTGITRDGEVSGNHYISKLAVPLFRGINYLGNGNIKADYKNGNHIASITLDINPQNWTIRQKHIMDYYVDNNKNYLKFYSHLDNNNQLNLFYSGEAQLNRAVFSYTYNNFWFMKPYYKNTSGSGFKPLTHGQDLNAIRDNINTMASLFILQLNMKSWIVSLLRILMRILPLTIPSFIYLTIHFFNIPYKFPLTIPLEELILWFTILSLLLKSYKVVKIYIKLIVTKEYKILFIACLINAIFIPTYFIYIISESSLNIVNIVGLIPI